MRARGSITGPLVLILVGVLFLIRALSPDFHFVDLVSRFWPYGLILWGLIALVEVCIRFLGNGPIPRERRFRRRLGVGDFCGASLDRRLSSSKGPATGCAKLALKMAWRPSARNTSIRSKPSRETSALAPHIVIEDFRGDAKIVGIDGTSISLGWPKDHSFV